MIKHSPETGEVRYALLTSKGNADYFISSDGRLFRVLEITASINRGGYTVVNTFDADGVLHPKTMHSLVAEAFIEPRPEGMTINHKDGDKGNNDVSNLEYMTLSDNVKHAFRTGLHNLSIERKAWLRDIGRRQKGGRKLSDEQVIALIRAYRSGGKSMKQVGREFGVDAATVCYAVNGKTWKNLQGQV